MYKFAHIADCHLGAQKYPELKELELRAFKEALDICMAEEVDFIIIAGDLFHSNLPDMGVVKEAVGKLSQVKEKGIPVYINYGSHDFSPNQTSIIDVITESGLMKKLFNARVVKDEQEREQIQLIFTIDPKTGAKLTGISGRKMGIDDSYYEILDRKSLEAEDGFKIFVYHTSVKNILPEYLIQMGGMDIKRFPRNFDYYAGGHIHKMVCEDKLEGYGVVTYSGPLFGGYPRDLEISAKGEKRGFYIIEYEDHINSCADIKFHPLELAKYLYLEFNADHKNSTQMNEEIKKELERRKNQGEIEGRIIVLKVRGELSGGKTSDVNFQEVRKYLKEASALHVSINYHGLVSREYVEIRVKGETVEEIEENLLLENLENIDLPLEELKGTNGKELATRLLKILRQNQKTNEKKGEYNLRILNESLSVLGLEDIIE
ncbi:MAG: DNA repair exonuclease [Methanobacteriaceae archaeon]|nr:DNA repair exonuclease [Methanobacteriaceae archaeon]